MNVKQEIHMITQFKHLSSQFVVKNLKIKIDY
jgi:hypothetical protein